jgi:hypothetical protein
MKPRKTPPTKGLVGVAHPRLVRLLCDRFPGWERRKDSLPDLIELLGVGWIIAEANRKPMLGRIALLGRPFRKGKPRVKPIRAVHLNVAGMGVDAPVVTKLVDGREGILGQPRPQHEVIVVTEDHSNITRESGDTPLHLGESDLLIPGN